jgi:hypothetical protein
MPIIEKRPFMAGTMGKRACPVKGRRQANQGRKPQASLRQHDFFGLKATSRGDMGAGDPSQILAWAWATMILATVAAKPVKAALILLAAF